MMKASGPAVLGFWQVAILFFDQPSGRLATSADAAQLSSGTCDAKSFRSQSDIHVRDDPAGDDEFALVQVNLGVSRRTAAAAGAGAAVGKATTSNAMKVAPIVSSTAAPAAAPAAQPAAPPAAAPQGAEPVSPAATTAPAANESATKPKNAGAAEKVPVPKTVSKSEEHGVKKDNISSPAHADHGTQHDHVSSPAKRHHETKHEHLSSPAKDHHGAQHDHLSPVAKADHGTQHHHGSSSGHADLGIKQEYVRAKFIILVAGMLFVSLMLCIISCCVLDVFNPQRSPREVPRPAEVKLDKEVIFTCIGAAFMIAVFTMVAVLSVCEFNSELGTNFMGETFPSGRNYFPQHIGEFLQNWSRATTSFFFACCLLSGLCLILSRVPSNVAVLLQQPRHRYWGIIRQCATPLSLIFMACVPTSRLAVAGHGGIWGQVAVIAHYIAFAIFSFSYLLTEGQALRREPLPPQIGTTEWKVRCILLFLGVFCFLVFHCYAFAGAIMTSRGVCCSDVWLIPKSKELGRLILKTGHFDDTAVVRAIVSGRPNESVLYDTATGAVLGVKVVQFFSQVFTCLFVAFSYMATWYYCTDPREHKPPEEEPSEGDGYAAPRVFTRTEIPSYQSEEPAQSIGVSQTSAAMGAGNPGSSMSTSPSTGAVMAGWPRWTSGSATNPAAASAAAELGPTVNATGESRTDLPGYVDDKSKIPHVKDFETDGRRKPGTQSEHDSAARRSNS